MSKVGGCCLSLLLAFGIFLAGCDSSSDSGVSEESVSVNPPRISEAQEKMLGVTHGLVFRSEGKSQSMSLEEIEKDWDLHSNMRASTEIELLRKLGLSANTEQLSMLWAGPRPATDPKETLWLRMPLIKGGVMWVSDSRQAIYGKVNDGLVIAYYDEDEGIRTKIFRSKAE